MATITLPRRTFIGAAIGLTAFSARARSDRTDQLIAGTYARYGGPGVVPLTAGPDGWTKGETVADVRNASFGVTDNRTGVRYLLEEQSDGMLHIRARDMRPLGSFPTLGADPCHAALSPDSRSLAIANYSSGSVTLWSLDPSSGLPVGEAQRVQHQGNGPNKSRQKGPHAHWVGFAAGGDVLHSVDLGADAIFAHRIDRQTGRVVVSSTAYRAEPGSGPRHLAYHPRLPVAYLVSELTSKVTVLAAGRDGSFTSRDQQSTLPAEFHGSSYVAHVAVNRAGTRLYVSNRGHNSIAVFAIDDEGALAPIQHASCGGDWPRLFLLLEGRGEMLVANERSGNVARLPIGVDGRLGPAAPGMAIPGVVFLSE